MRFTNAQAVITYLYSLPHLHPKNDLSFIKRILQQLGNPQDQVKTVHITGTNGKGSTSYYLANLLKKAGQKTGLFVSPYVYRFNERIQLNGIDISDHDLVETANQVEAALAEIRKTDPAFALVTFEYEVALAFVYFAEQKCDYAVIEVGIGGEHDKTNVITPEVSIITTIGLDHEQIIGPTIQDIAKEKSGIIKHKRAVVLGNVPETVLPIICKKAQKESAAMYQLGRNFYIDNSYAKPYVELVDAAAAVQAFKLLKLKLTPQQIHQAVALVHIPGRFQFLQRDPDILLDGAHNIQAIANILQFARNIKKQKQGQLYVLVAMMKDKDIGPVLAQFKDCKVVLTRVNYPRGAKEADFRKQSKLIFPYNDNWRDAYQQLRCKLKAKDILLVTGSFYLVSAVLNMKELNG